MCNGLEPGPERRSLTWELTGWGGLFREHLSATARNHSGGNCFDISINNSSRWGESLLRVKHISLFCSKTSDSEVKSPLIGFLRNFTWDNKIQTEIKCF